MAFGKLIGKAAKRLLKKSPGASHGPGGLRPGMTREDFLAETPFLRDFPPGKWPPGFKAAGDPAMPHDVKRPKKAVLAEKMAMMERERNANPKKFPGGHKQAQAIAFSKADVRRRKKKH